jgi:hypothetical protein
MYGGDFVSTRFSIAWVSLPILFAVGILELRWTKEKLKA